jgi:hypothetical protein
MAAETRYKHIVLNASQVPIIAGTKYIHESFDG